MEEQEKAFHIRESNGFFTELNSRNELYGAIHGIYQQLSTKGYDSLSSLQIESLDGFIDTYKRRNICKNCDNKNINILRDFINISDTGMCLVCENESKKN